MFPHVLNSHYHSQCCAIFPDLSTQCSHGLNMFKWIHCASWQVASTSASSTESKNRSTSCSSRPLQLKSLKTLWNKFFDGWIKQPPTKHNTWYHFCPGSLQLGRQGIPPASESEEPTLERNSISGTPRRWNRVRCVSDSIQHSCVPRNKLHNHVLRKEGQAH